MPRTGILVVILPVVVLGGCDSGTRHRNAEQEIIALEHNALGKWSQGNTLGYVDIADDDITYFDDIGGQSRIDGLDSMRKYLASLEGKVAPHKYDMVNPKVQVYGEIGILTLQYHPSTIEGKPLTKWKATSVYRHHGGKWHLVHANWSVIKEP